MSIASCRLLLPRASSKLETRSSASSPRTGIASDRRRSSSRSDPSTIVFAEIVGPASRGATSGSGGISSMGLTFGTDGSTRAPKDIGGVWWPGHAQPNAFAPAHHMSSTTDSATHGAMASA